MLPGDVGYIRNGVYKQNQYTQRSGTPDNPIIIKAYKNEHPILQGTGLSSNGGMFRLLHDWYIIENIEFKDAACGIQIRSEASHNNIINCKIHSCYYDGIFMEGGAAYNKIVNCDAYDMYDSGTNGGNADGFSINGQVHPAGPGNEFIGCRAWNNSDDGYDVWKSAFPVTFTNCLSYDNGTHDGDGNGFKLGINATDKDKHTLKNCVAWGNRQNGFDYNVNSNLQTLFNCTAWNDKRNYKFSNEGGGPMINNNTEATISIYPIPTNNLLKIDDLLTKNCLISIYNSRSQLIKSTQSYGSKSITIKLNRFSAGVYFCKITQNNRVIIIKRIVVN